MRFMFNATHHMWAGFLDGWYKNARVKFEATDECFGSWIEDDFWDLDSTVNKVLELDILDLTYEEIKTAANDIVELLFKQDEECGFRKFIKDFLAFCDDPEADNCNVDKTFAHIQKHMFELINKFSLLADAFKRAEEATTFENVYETCEDLGEAFGSILGSVVDYK